MDLTPLTASLAIASGGAVGLMLGLVGGGGSIIAVPLLIYLVGVTEPHVAIGTAAVAVALNAGASLATHARSGTVKWPCAIVFAISGVAGAAVGAEIGKSLDGEKLLGLFGIAMMAVALSMLRPRSQPENAAVRLNQTSAAELLPKLLTIGFGVGLLAGFFGIGGGFLIVPGLMLATAMPLANAIGTSLVAVTAFGLTTASSYAMSGFIDWPLAFLAVGGGVMGAMLGNYVGYTLSKNRRMLTHTFAGVVFATGVFVFSRGASELL